MPDENDKGWRSEIGWDSSSAAKVSAGVEPAGTRGAATSPDEPGYVAPSGFSPGGCAAPAHSPKLGPDRRGRDARFVPGVSASPSSDKTPDFGSSGPSSAANRYRELHPVQREALWLLLGVGLTERGKEGWLEWRLAEGYAVERIFADAIREMEGQVSSP